MTPNENFPKSGPPRLSWWRRFRRIWTNGPVETARAPAAIGPYSQGVYHRILYSGEIFFSSGQISLDPTTGCLVEGGIAEQTARVLDNLEAVLAETGLGWDDVVKTTVFMTDLAGFAEMNAVYEKRLAPNKPARSAVQVAALPKGATIEIELIAIR